MSDSAETSSHQTTAADGQPTPAPARAPWPPSPSPQESAASPAADHPELIVGAAFAGGLLAAMILKRLAR